MIADLVGKTFEEYNCWDLAIEIYKRNGKALRGFDICVDAVKKISAVYDKEMTSDHWEEIKQPEEFCIIPMRVHPKYISHCGIYIGAGQFIHSLHDQGVIISNLNDPLWKSKIEGFYRAC